MTETLKKEYGHNLKKLINIFPAAERLTK